MTMLVLRSFFAFPIVNDQPDYDDAQIIERDVVVDEVGRWLEGGVLFATADTRQYVTDIETFNDAVVP